MRPEVDVAAAHHVGVAERPEITRVCIRTEERVRAIRQRGTEPGRGGIADRARDENLDAQHLRGAAFAQIRAQRHVGVRLCVAEKHDLLGSMVDVGGHAQIDDLFVDSESGSARADEQEVGRRGIGFEDESLAAVHVLPRHATRAQPVVRGHDDEGKGQDGDDETSDDETFRTHSSPRTKEE